MILFIIADDPLEQESYGTENKRRKLVIPVDHIDKTSV